LNFSFAFDSLPGVETAEEGEEHVGVEGGCFLGEDLGDALVSN